LATYPTDDAGIDADLPTGITDAIAVDDTAEDDDRSISAWIRRAVERELAK